MSELTYTVSSTDGIANGTFKRPEVLPQPGDRLIVTQAFFTPGPDVYNEGDILILIERTDEAPHDRVSSLGNWRVASKAGITIWSNIEYAIAETKVLAPLETERILFVEDEGLVRYDVDLILRAIDDKGEQYLVLWVDQEVSYTQWLIVPMTNAQYEQLTKANYLECLSLRDFIRGSPRMYMSYSLWGDFAIEEHIVVPITQLSEDLMPLEGGYILTETYVSWSVGTGQS